jgi:uncharacterized membrane protein YuzA (DUF378 family)
MQSSGKEYFLVKLQHLFLVLVFVGALNWGSTAFGYNVVDIVSRNINELCKCNLYLDKIIYVLVALSAVKLILDRDTWLPFLGKNVLPCSLIPMREIKGDTVVTVNVKPNTRVAYWASLPQKSDVIPDVVTAYGDYSNAGVVMSDATGKAMLVINKGTDYYVPRHLYNKKIKRHVHYRELCDTFGMVKPIKTVQY